MQVMNSARAKAGSKQKLGRLKKPRHAPLATGGQWQANQVLYQFGHMLHAGDNTQHTSIPVSAVRRDRGPAGASVLVGMINRQMET